MPDAPQTPADLNGTFALSREEAVEVVREMRLTGPDHYTIDNPHTRADVDAVISRMQLEAAVRDAGGWWADKDPAERAESGQAPATFDLAAQGLPAFAELLPQLMDNIGGVLRDCEHARGPESAEECTRRLDEAECVRNELRLLNGIAQRLLNGIAERLAIIRASTVLTVHDGGRKTS